MVKNIIFDLGNVLLRFAPLEYLRAMFTDENTVQQLYREIFLSEEWLMLDRGIITEEDALQRIIARGLCKGDEVNNCMNQWYQLLTPIDETVEILKKVKSRGYKTFVLSNFHLLAYEHVTSCYDFFKYFDGEIISYREKLLKPEGEIYNKLITRYAVNPSQSIFIDDTKANIEGAKALGFKTILFDNPSQLQYELAKLGI